MNTAFIKTISWTKFLMALTFLSSIFCFSAMAQAKPLDAKSRAALIEELKGIVARTEPDEKLSAKVAQKWAARKDLAGKTKTQVIKLLYQDVKSVITDSGKQYEIYSVFSMYKQMPDDQFSSKSGSKHTTSSKKEIVEKLVDLVFVSHPYVNIEEQLEGLPGTKETKAAQEEDRKNRIGVFEAALKINTKLTPDQKAFVRANYDKLIKITDKTTEDAINKNFPIEQWIQEGLEKIFTEQFTVEEINNLTAFFDSDKGAQVLNYIRQINLAALITGNGGKLDYTAADQAEHDKFAATLGKKFIAPYLTDAEAYEKRKENAARSKPDADGFAVYEPENLNKLFNKFVADNYKK